MCYTIFDSLYICLLNEKDSETNQPIPSIADRFHTISKHVCQLYSKAYVQLPLLVNLVLCANPHSMGVERAISHYNLIRSDRRLSMSIQSTNDRLMIALNGPGTAYFDPRASVSRFLMKKERRLGIPMCSTYTSRPFVQKFFRNSATENSDKEISNKD